MTTVTTRPAPIVQRKKKRLPMTPPVPAGHELTVKFSELPTPVIGEQGVHKITVRLNINPPFYVNVELKKKQWNKLVKGVNAAQGTWVAAGRGSIRNIVRNNIYLENVGFQVFEKKPKTELQAGASGSGSEM